MNSASGSRGPASNHQALTLHTRHVSKEPKMCQRPGATHTANSQDDRAQPVPSKDPKAPTLLNEERLRLVLKLGSLELLSPGATANSMYSCIGRSLHHDIQLKGWVGAEIQSTFPH